MTNVFCPFQHDFIYLTSENENISIDALSKARKMSFLFYQCHSTEKESTLGNLKLIATSYSFAKEYLTCQRARIEQTNKYIITFRSRPTGFDCRWHFVRLYVRRDETQYSMSSAIFIQSTFSRLVSFLHSCIIISTNNLTLSRIRNEAWSFGLRIKMAR